MISSYRTTIPAVMLALLFGAGLHAAQSTTTQVSVATNGTSANRFSYRPRISADGEHVAFHATANNLGQVNDSNGQPDVFLRHVDSGITETVSIDLGGTRTASGASENPSVSQAGRWVAFESLAADLIVGDTNAQRDIFVRDMQLGITERVSMSTGGIATDGNCFHPSISGDGRFVAFQSWGTNLVANDFNGWQDVFLHDRQLGTTICLSVDAAGIPANGFSTDPAISTDGNFIAFASSSTNLVSGDNNGVPDIFVYDRVAGSLELVSLSNGGAQGSFSSALPSISADGRWIAFETLSNNLVGSDSNNATDIFLRDRLSGTIARMSVDTAGIEGDSNSFEASVSADGNQVAFRSVAENLIATDSNLVGDVFLRDVAAGTTIRISESTGGGQSNGHSTLPTISDDGTRIAYQSLASNLSLPDTDNLEDDFLYDTRALRDSIVLLGPNSAAAGSVVNFDWSNAPANAPYRLLYSFSNTGSTVLGHGFDLGPPLLTAANGHNNANGSGNLHGRIPAGLAGNTLYLEVGAQDNGELFDSNLLALTVL